MMEKVNKYLLLAVAAIALFSCAQEKDESERSIQERILDAYVEVNCPDADRWDSGIVMLNREEGTGDTLNMYEAGFFKYSIQSISGNYTETNYEDLAKVLGTYSKSNYYGPKYYDLGYETTYAGLEEVMYKMRVGGKAKFILPPWLSNTTEDGSWNNGTSVIYEIELKDVVENMLEWQQDTMKAYANTHYPGLDTLSANFYFKKLYDAGADTLKNENVNVRYIGRLLDGWVFDTNIADTAKKYGIYDKTKEYNALQVLFNEELTQMVEDNSLVEGFCMALQNMSYGDKAFTMFYSEYGYSTTGSDQIGPYQPLIFWLYIEPDDDADDSSSDESEETEEE